jgi:CRP-like cAMP-binding protein
MDQKLETLASVPLLEKLDRKDLVEVGKLSDVMDFPAGRVIARQGAHADEFFVILEGQVRIDQDGRHLSDLGPGDFLGEMALLGRIPRTATATCVTPCRMLVLGRREFSGLLATHPSIPAALLQAVADRMATLQPERAC